MDGLHRVSPERAEVLKKLSAIRNQPILLTEDYDTSWQPCWKCGRYSLAYCWGYNGSDEPPPEPRPWTVQFRYSKTRDRSYWANTCALCGAMQGDWFVFREPSGAFFGNQLRCLGEEIEPGDPPSEVLRALENPTRSLENPTEQNTTALPSGSRLRFITRIEDIRGPGSPPASVLDTATSR